MTPGDPASIILGQDATKEQINDLREQLGLNQPIYEQYISWIGGVFQGDFGTSIFMKQSVLSAIVEHLQPTLSLAILAHIISLLIALPLGDRKSTRLNSSH